LLNFAHGDIYMTGAFVCLSVFGILTSFLSGWAGIAIAILGAMVVTALLGWTVQRLAYRPLLGAPRLSLMITAIGVSLIISNAAMLITKSRPSFFHSGLSDTTGISIGNVKITYVRLVLLGLSAAAMIGLTLFVNRTKTGRAMRAISMDQDTCRLMGVNVKSVIGVTFMIGSALAAVAGGMACVQYGTISYNMGYLIGIKAFSAAVIGGIGSIPGAMLGGLLLGLLEAFGTQIPFIGSQWKDVFAFGLLIFILIFRPNGLLGKTTIERM
ncbi:MAG: branched-chain amino acid ABC transporter permease, partial [Clostridia bacterium]|nr:branched-chain amino acid ABC transporter permease [Clostridia bacterium]